LKDEMHLKVADAYGTILLTFDRDFPKFKQHTTLKTGIL